MQNCAMTLQWSAMTFDLRFASNLAAEVGKTVLIKEGLKGTGLELVYFECKNRVWRESERPNLFGVRGPIPNLNHYGKR